MGTEVDHVELIRRHEPHDGTKRRVCASRYTKARRHEESVQDLVRIAAVKETLMLTRREFGKIALAGLPAATVVGSGSIFGAFAQTRPNSLIEGVQIGTITYSFRSMTDQSAE